MSENSLIIFSRASQMLAEATTIQKAKELKDLALTAADWARRKGMGEEAVQNARGYALDAERKMGELLLTKPRAFKSGPGRGKKGGAASSPGLIAKVPSLKDLGLSKHESKQAQKLAKLSSEEFEQLKAGTFKLHNLERGRIAENTGEYEWYTPPAYIAAAKKVMGDIDLDPASSEKANKIVGAKRFLTAADNALTAKWEGRVWMNPPYGQPLITQFSEAVVKKFTSHEIAEACILVNNATETAWFQGLMKAASAICFPKGRITFLDENHKSAGVPLQGQAVVYLGKNAEKFRKVFGKFGVSW
jgi:ParB family chromosome partitioning protein